MPKKRFKSMSIYDVVNSKDYVFIVNYCTMHTTTTILEYVFKKGRGEFYGKF